MTKQTKKNLFRGRFSEFIFSLSLLLVLPAIPTIVRRKELFLKA